MLETDLVAEYGNLKAAGRAAGANYARGEFGEDFGEFCQVSTSGGRVREMCARRELRRILQYC